MEAETLAELADAEQHARLAKWAAKKAAEEGMPQADMMQQKADKAVAAYEALKLVRSGGPPNPPKPTAQETIQRTITSTPLMVEEITELEKQVKLLAWAARTAAEQGMPQAEAAQVRADQAVQKLMQLKEQQEAHEGGKAVTQEPKPVVSAVPAAPVAPAAPAITADVSKAEVDEAEKRARLAAWAAGKAAEEGMPQAAMMRAKADAAAGELAALREALERQEASRPVATRVQDVVPAPAAPAPPSSKPSLKVFEEIKKEMRLLLWAAKTAAEQGMPQADMMKGKADAKVQEYESMKRQMEA